jgi:glycosyltransferase involved in cell wall biosynthesis
MKRGVPVVCSNMGSLPEILGESAVYFNPLDINDITEKIKMVLIDNNLTKKLVQNGFEQALKYSWSDMAEKTLKQYLL